MSQLPRATFALLATAAIACAAEQPEPVDEVDATLASYGSAAQDLEHVVATYAALAAGAGDATCRAAMDAYLADAEDALARMADRCERIDGMMARRDPASADSLCVAAMMAAELAYHHETACGAEPTAEASRHVAAMSSCLAHERARYDALGAAMGMMPFPAMGGATWTCARTPDGGFLVNGQPWSPGASLPGVDASGTSGGEWPMPCLDGSCGCADDEDGDRWAMR